MKLKVYATLALVIIGLLIVSCSCAPTSCPEIGSEAPNFTLESTDGNNVSLEDFKGNMVKSVEYAVHVYTDPHRNTIRLLEHLHPELRRIFVVNQESNSFGEK